MKILKIEIMKLVKNYFLFILSITIVFVSCKKDDIEQNSANTKQKNKTFAIYDINGKQCQYLEPSLLKTIQKDLISKGDKAKASELMEQYDNITGVLKSSNFIVSQLSENEFRQESILKTTNGTVTVITGQGHVEGIQWQPLKILYPVYTVGDPINYVGIVGQSRRLEAFIMNYGGFDPNTYPKILFSMKNGLGVWKTAQWSQICGTTGQSLANFFVQCTLLNLQVDIHIFRYDIKPIIKTLDGVLDTEIARLLEQTKDLKL